MKRFWQWYERNYVLNLGLAAGLFSLQLVHLFWLTTHVVWQRLFGQPLYTPGGLFEWFILIVDYTEIPALVSTSLVYLHELKSGFKWKAFSYLVFLNSQWLHIFWITDEFVLEKFSGASLVMLPVWLAWLAILIDYLELPVIWDTLRLFGQELKKGNVKKALAQLKEE